MSRALFPKISPYDELSLDVGDGHRLYIEQSGNPDGIAIVYLHGGPGAGCNPHHRRLFDPRKYRIILFDQRGCGRSTPSPSISTNATNDLIKDLEIIREKLSVKQWVLSGGSWGTTLALLYGINYPTAVSAFILRGIFLGTEAEYQWLYGAQGAAKFFPEYYQDFIEALPEDQRDNPITGYTEILNSTNELAAISASKSWFLWEFRLSSIEHQHISKEHIEDPHQAHSMALISNHYFLNKCFVEENYIIDNIEKIAHIPGIILHGRYDMVCQLAIAHDLAKVWPFAQLQILPLAGHSGFEKQTIDAFCKASDKMADFIEEINL